MSIENRVVQADLRRRTTYFATLPRKELISSAVQAIAEQMPNIKHRSGEVVLPYTFSITDEISIRELMQKKFGNYAYRVGAFTPIRLPDSIGTAILITEKGRR